MSLDAFSKNTLVPLILRLTLGAIFIFHGLDKILPRENDLGFAWATQQWKRQGQVPEGVMAALDKIPLADPEKKEDVKAAAEKRDEIKGSLQAHYRMQAGDIPTAVNYHLSQFAVAWGELIGGAALVLGFLTRLAALGLIAIQAGAVATVTWARGFSFELGAGYEYNLALMAMCLCLVLVGGGPLALSHLLTPKHRAHHEKPVGAAV
jgi:uncharacterized membrane protein YphA (DoxX/SURF4 family)